jgi:V8-like Glu-specific endopeptidase
MRRMARDARGCGARDWRRPAGLLAVLATAVACGALMLIPADSGATAVTQRGGLVHRAGLALRGGLTVRRAPTASRTGQAFGGVAAVGALFTMSSGKLGSHFCTASVVHSPRGDLAVTAAHCVTGKPGQIVFVPGYANGQEPYGVWPVTAVYTDQAWQASQNPDDDVAFLRLSGAGDGVPIEDVTGAEQIDTGWQAHPLVQVIGYPDGADQPVLCANWTKTFSPTQLEFDCGGYTNGTSGGPFVADVSAVSGEGTIIGVIGGYEQGGDTPDVSYASAFGTAVAALYQTAAAG